MNFALSPISESMQATPSRLQVGNEVQDCYWLQLTLTENNP